MELLQLTAAKEHTMVDMASKMDDQITGAICENERLHLELDGLKQRINSPELENFLRAVHIEAVHNVELSGAAGVRAKVMQEPKMDEMSRARRASAPPTGVMMSAPFADSDPSRETIPRARLPAGMIGLYSRQRSP